MVAAFTRLARSAIELLIHHVVDSGAAVKWVSTLTQRRKNAYDIISQLHRRRLCIDDECSFKNEYT